MSYIDSLLNKVAMYRLVLYVLLALMAVAVAFGFFGSLPYSGFSLLASITILIGTCYSSNVLLATLFRAPYNIESSFITACILFFILTPASNGTDALTLVTAAAIAMSSKYIVAWRAQHIFNPAAFAAFAVSMFGYGAAIWWVATPSLLIPALIAGLLIVRKVRRFDVFLTFLAATIAAHTTINTSFFTSWPVIFFGTVMLTEPRTGPLTTWMRYLYAGTVGILFSWQGALGPVHTTPEFALLVGNLLVFLVNPRQRTILRLRSRTQLTPTINEYEFESNTPVRFVAGQYGEWTLPHSHPDTRGVRRYFTVASSPEDSFLRIATRSGESSFKQTLSTLGSGDTIVLSHISGTFVLPQSNTQKLLWIAGGIGITPFISMMRRLHTQNETRNIVLIYVCSSPEDVPYRALIDRLATQIGLQVHYVTGSTRIKKDDIKQKVPDYAQRTVYISGPDGLVRAIKKQVWQLGVPPWRIKTDYFPGL